MKLTKPNFFLTTTFHSKNLTKVTNILEANFYPHYFIKVDIKNSPNKLFHRRQLHDHTAPKTEIVFPSYGNLNINISNLLRHYLKIHQFFDLFP